MVGVRVQVSCLLRYSAVFTFREWPSGVANDARMPVHEFQIRSVA